MNAPRTRGEQLFKKFIQEHEPLFDDIGGYCGLVDCRWCCLAKECHWTDTWPSDYRQWRPSVAPSLAPNELARIKQQFPEYFV